MTSITPITKVGSTDISAYVEYGPTKARGGERNVKSDPIVGSNQAVFWEEGRKPISWDLGLLFRTTLADQIGTSDTITALIDDLAGDQDTDLFYPGRDDRFAVIEKASVHDPYTRRGGGGANLYKDATLYSKATELYSATPSSWSPTDEQLPITQASGEENGGNLEAGLYSLALTARASGPALRFDGTDDYVTAGSIGAAGDALSVEIFCRLDTLPAKGIFSVGNGAVTGSLELFHVSGGTTIYCSHYDAVGREDHAFGANTVGWHRIGLSFDKTNSEIKLFIDGEQFGDTWAKTCAALADLTVTFGLQQRLSRYFDGAMAWVRMWTRVVSPAEFLAAHNGEAVDDTSLVIEYDFCEGSGATVYDLSGNGNDGTLTNFADTSAGYGDSHNSGWMSDPEYQDQLTSPTLELLSGATVVAEMALSPSLMCGETLNLDRFGQISQTYTDNFGSATRYPSESSGYGYFWADGYAYAKYIGSEIVLTSLINGHIGEEISITIADTDQASTTVSVSGYDITVDLETSRGSPVATAQEVIDAINADEDAAALVLASLASGEDGTTVMAVLSQTYLDLNVDVTGGALVIEDDREALYKLVGSWPIRGGGLVVAFTPTMTGSGVATLEVSADSGGTWEEVSDSSEWSDGIESEIKVPQAEGCTTVWIRFACDSDITSLSIADLSITQERYVSSSSVPQIGVGDTRKIKIDGAGWGNVTTVWRDRYRP